MKGIVASGHPRVTEAAAVCLRAGGNAFDAAVAAGFASSVAEPALTSLGGGGFLLARPAAGAPVLFDFFVDTPGRGAPAAAARAHFVPVTVRFPGSDQVFNAGLGAAAVPGTLRGLLTVHRRLGRLPLADVVAPAVALARDGVVLNERQAYFLDLLQPIMTLTPAAAALFAPGGRYLREGDRFTNPDLAAFLAGLPAHGDGEFYEGAVAARIAADMAAGGGSVGTRDLAAYAVVERAPLALRYRGLDVLTNPPPSFGGTLVGLTLALLEAVELGPMGLGSPRHLTTLVAALEEVERQRPEVLHGRGLSGSDLAASVARVRTASRGTTHVSAWDADGNAASMTTSNGEGSGYVVPGTGVMLNNMMGEDDLHPAEIEAPPAGTRVASMMSPSIVVDGARVRLVVGTGGSKRIRTALVQIISAVVDFGLGVDEAIGHGRLHWDGACVQCEPGFSAAAVAALRRRWPVNVWPVRDVYFGGAHAVIPGHAGAGDARRGGSAAIV